MFKTVYLNLFFKSVKADARVSGGKRVKTLIRRFLQNFKVSGGQGATEFVAGRLFLLGEASVFYR